MHASFFEIYCGNLYDLLNNRNRLHAREDAQKRVCIGGLVERRVSTAQEIMELIVQGGAVRSTGIGCPPWPAVLGEP